jgi:WD40 repeat protein
MWSTKDGGADQRWQELGELRGHGTPVWAVAVSPDGRQIASGGTDGSIITWSSRSAFGLDARREPSAAGNSPSAPANADKSSCPDDLALPPKLDVAACARSPNGRVVVAFKSGRIEVFDQESDAYVKVDDYQGPPDVAAIRFAGDRLIVEYRSGEKIGWPFFDSLSDVIRRSLGHDPISVDGNEKMPLTLSKELRCRIDEQDPDCESQSSSFIERP